MYTPSYYKVTDTAKINDLVRTYPFGILVSSKDNNPAATHLPFLLTGNAGPGGKLVSHMAKANPHWQTIDGDALVIFHGPHTYISSSWYKENDGIPTWNYAAVHVYGKLTLITDTEAVLQILQNTIATFDPELLAMWEDPKHLEYFQKNARGVVGFEIAITKVEAKLKMSQNRTEEDQQRVIDALMSNRSDEESQKVAAMISSRRR